MDQERITSWMGSWLRCDYRDGSINVSTLTGSWELNSGWETFGMCWAKFLLGDISAFYFNFFL